VALDGRHYALAMPKGSVATLRWKPRGSRQ